MSDVITDSELTLISTVSPLSPSHEWIHDDQSHLIEQRQTGGVSRNRTKLSACFAERQAGGEYQ